MPASQPAAVHKRSSSLDASSSHSALSAAAMYGLQTSASLGGSLSDDAGFSLLSELRGSISATAAPSAAPKPAARTPVRAAASFACPGYSASPKPEALPMPSGLLLRAARSAKSSAGSSPTLPPSPLMQRLSVRA